MYIVVWFKDESPVPDAVLYNSVEDLREARDRGDFLNIFHPVCFFVDPESRKLTKQSTEFLEENICN